jgi:hypothetical protein
VYFFYKPLFNLDLGGYCVMISKKKALPNDCEIFDFDGKPFTTTHSNFESPGFVYLAKTWPCPSSLTLRKSKNLRPMSLMCLLKSAMAFVLDTKSYIKLISTF